MQIINDSTVVVFSYAELKTALEQNNNYTYIYLGANITLENGISLPNTKSSITIDGTYDNVKYTFTDKKTLAAGDTIRANAKNTKVTVCNMDIVGNNYYGIIYVPESASYASLIVEYKNISYTGPQISFHPNGTTRFIDADITITDTSLTSGNEVAECNKIEIGGKTTILHKSTGNSAFWFRNPNPSLTILLNADVNFTSEARELFYGPTNLAFSILANASFKVTSKNGMAYGSFGTGKTIIDKKASFILKQTGTNGNYPTWYSYGALTLETDSTLKIINDYTNINTNNYNIYFNSSAASFTLNNPKEVILYNSKANVFYTSSTIPFSFTFSRLNLFNTVIALDSILSSSTLPTYSWYKEIEASSVTGTFSNTTSNITSHNFTTEELSDLPALTNFVFPNKKIFSLGTLPLKIKALTDEDTKIIGHTLPLSTLLITYNDTVYSVTADETGAFSHSYDTPLKVGTIIRFDVKENDTVLYKTKSVTIVYPGEIIMENVPSLITFELTPISLSPLLCPRKEDIQILVTDSRVNSEDWNLYLTVTSELKDGDNVLDGALVFLDNDTLTTLTSEKTLVYKGLKNEGNIKETTITWTSDKGLLFHVNKPLKNVATYKATLLWTLE